MSHTTDLIDAIKRKRNLPSDYAAAKSLGLTTQAIGNYRANLSHADDRVAILLADELGLDRLKTIARINSERAKKPEDRAFWKRIAAAAATVIAIYMSMRPHTSDLALVLPIFLHKLDTLDITHLSGFVLIFGAIIVSTAAFCTRKRRSNGQASLR